MISNFSIIEIAPGLKFCQNQIYKFSSDSIRLFDYIKNIETPEILELGCGDGIISVLYALKNKQSLVYSLDINSDVLSCLKQTVKINNIKNIEIIESDMEWYSISSKKTFPLVTMNPPYYNCFEGKLNDNPYAITAKHQILCNETIFLNSGYRLSKKKSGRFIIIYPKFKITNKFIEKIYLTGFKSHIVIDTSNPRFQIVEMIL
ncbi:methyltransferase [Candidatus Dependentiae bacterium]|nr:methyltransferase [Candidatus Dependentiae bacterium]